MQLNEIYPDPRIRPVNTIEVPLEAFLAMSKVIRDIRELHKPNERGWCEQCNETLQPTYEGCPTIQTFATLDNLEDPTNEH